MEKKFPTPKHVDLFGMDAGNLRGVIQIDIGNNQQQQIDGRGDLKRVNDIDGDGS